MWTSISYNPQLTRSNFIDEQDNQYHSMGLVWRCNNKHHPLKNHSQFNHSQFPYDESSSIVHQLQIILMLVSQLQCGMEQMEQSHTNKRKQTAAVCSQRSSPTNTNKVYIYITSALYVYSNVALIEVVLFVCGGSNSVNQSIISQCNALECTLNGFSLTHS